MVCVCSDELELLSGDVMTHDGIPTTKKMGAQTQNASRTRMAAHNCAKESKMGNEVARRDRTGGRNVAAAGNVRQRTNEGGGRSGGEKLFSWKWHERWCERQAGMAGEKPKEKGM